MPSYVMITGAAGGLGKALASEYAERGHALFLTDVSSQALNTFTAGLRRMTEVDVISYACDLTDPSSADRMWAWIEKNGLVFDGLLNVAGVNHQGRFEEVDTDRLQTMVKLNIEALVSTTRRVLDHRAPGRDLRIVNVASLGIFYPLPLKAVYASSKRFVYDFSLALNDELRGDGVSVLVVCPAGLPTKPANIKGVNQHHGFWGFMTEKNVGWLADQIYDRSLKGQAVLIPGAVNVFLSWLRVLPRGVLGAYLRGHWAKAKRRSAKKESEGAGRASSKNAV